MSTDPSHMSGGAPIVPPPPESVWAHDAPPLYTLEEAAIELAKRECAIHGHDTYNEITVGGEIVALICDRCGAAWNVTPR